MSGSVLDAIMMERRGIAAAPVGTERLAQTTGRGMARLQGLPDFPIAIIHGRGRLESLTDPGEQDSVMWEFLAQVVAILTSGRSE
jgi:hypothetical protein